MDKISFLKLSEVLEEKGKTFYSLRKDKIVGTETIRKLQQNNGSIDTRTIKNICAYLECQPGDIMRYLPEWVENRILELTELREEELKDYYIENSEDYSEQLFYERSADFYENMLPEEIEKLKISGNYESEFIDTLEDIIDRYDILNMHDDDWKKLIEEAEEECDDTESEDEYDDDETEEFDFTQSDLIEEVENYLEPITNLFWDEIREERETYIKEQIEQALDEEKAAIEKQAFEEYFSDPEE